MRSRIACITSSSRPFSSIKSLRVTLSHSWYDTKPSMDRSLVSSKCQAAIGIPRCSILNSRYLITSVLPMPVGALITVKCPCIRPMILSSSPRMPVGTYWCSGVSRYNDKKSSVLFRMFSGVYFLAFHQADLNSVHLPACRKSLASLYCPCGTL